MKSRTKARAIALQVLYEIDLSGHLPEIVFEERCREEPIDNSLEEFARKLVFGIYPIIAKLDMVIAEHAPEWPLDQVAVIDRNIIRIALWEFAVSGATPLRVAINEAIELAKYFGSDNTPRFVNGVLGSLAIRQNELKMIFALNSAE
jgi:N utilization substance protein B